MELSLLMLILYNIFVIKIKYCQKETPHCFMDPKISKATNAETIGGYLLVILIGLTLIMEILKVGLDVFSKGRSALGCDHKKIDTDGVAAKIFNKGIDNSSEVYSPAKTVKTRKKQLKRLKKKV